MTAPPATAGHSRSGSGTLSLTCILVRHRLDESSSSDGRTSSNLQITHPAWRRRSNVACTRAASAVPTRTMVPPSRGSTSTQIPSASRPFNTCGNSLWVTGSNAATGAALSGSTSSSYQRRWAASSFIVPCRMTCPRTMIARRLQISSSSLSRWEFMNTVRPSSRSRLSTMRMSLRPMGSTPSVGSSSTTSSGSFISAWATPTRCIMPLEYVSTRRSPHCCMFTNSRSSPARRFRFARSTPAIAPKNSSVWRPVRYRGNRCCSGK